MKCPICKSGVLEARRETHHYTESGLHNVYLVNIEVKHCTSCGERMPAIPRITKLHKVLAHAIAGQKAKLTGEEIRFLRKHLGFSGGVFAKTIAVTAETVSRWENDKDPMGATAERLLRLMVLTREPVEEYPLNELEGMAQDDAPRIKWDVCVQDSDWKAAPASA